jgi:hypothetical protein
VVVPEPDPGVAAVAVGGGGDLVGRGGEFRGPVGGHPRGPGSTGDAEQQQRFITEIGLRLGRPDYQPPEGGDAIAHWMKFDSDRPPSKPHKLFPDTREHGSTRHLETDRAAETG